jgi:hypothetical protein
MTEEEDFWSGDEEATQHADPEVPPEADHAGTLGGQSALVTPEAGSALVGFTTGGLPGLLGVLDAHDGASFEDDVEDPEALRRAEEAVTHDRPDAGPRQPIDGPWTVVATQDSAADSTGLELVVQALEAEGIDCGWDPYDPRDTVNFMPPSAGLTARKLFSIMVPESEAARARESLRGAPPFHGVTYVWDVPGSAAVPVSTAAPGATQDAGFDPAAPVPTPVTSAGSGLSDNDRLEQLAGDSSRTGAVVVFIGVVLVMIVVFAFLMMRG